MHLKFGSITIFRNALMPSQNVPSVAYAYEVVLSIHVVLVAIFTYGTSRQFWVPINIYDFKEIIRDGFLAKLNLHYDDLRAERACYTFQRLKTPVKHSSNIHGYLYPCIYL